MYCIIQSIKLYLNDFELLSKIDPEVMYVVYEMMNKNLHSNNYTNYNN